ncbi:MAG TPA: hypothetical protein VGM80_07330 [Gaiellaceae bacterium]
MKGLLVSAGLLAVLAVAAAGCGSGKTAATSTPRTSVAAAKPACAYPAGWKLLANRISADVYCPGWLPGPLTSQIGGRWNNVNAVSKDRSYLISFVWQETEVGINGAGGEFHVNLRGYPGTTKIPTCLAGLTDTTPTPCFAQPHGFVTANGIKATLYTVNQDSDQWHLLLAWRHGGGLYTVSEHLAPPLDYTKLVSFLKHELGSLVLVAPTRST